MKIKENKSWEGPKIMSYAFVNSKYNLLNVNNKLANKNTILEFVEPGKGS